MNAPTTVPVEERLFSLVLALLATETGLTKAEILSTVQGYRQRYQPGGDNANLERQFERDKDDIRDLGVPLETIESPGAAGNNQSLRYRIPKGAYELPEEVRFTSAETALLNLAAMVWREGSLSGESRRALLKLRSLGVTADEPVLGYAPRLRLRDAAFDPLSTALERRVLVRFPYLKPGETSARERQVIPLALVQYQGRWHLSARELGGAHKTFLLRRIVGPVQLGKPAPYRPEDADHDHRADAIASLERIWAANVAELEVVPGSDAATRLSVRRGAVVDGDRITVHFVDRHILADELTGFGPEVLVLGPAELRDAVRERLELVATDHG